jgi:TRAF3-interacting protein 1
MGDEYWQPTAQCFEQLFSKPKMTEKLLCRPPFRYVHDIYTATLAATGFGEGLFSGDELDAKAIKDKDAKTNFLEKLIALVQMAAGEEIPVKSSKVVAGQEPEATNIFLQYLFKVATSGIDSGPIVAEIVGGGGEFNGQEEAEEEDVDDGDDGDAAQRQAEEEEERKRQKRASKKKQMEEEAQQEAEEEDKKQKKSNQEAQKQAEKQAKAQQDDRKKAAKKPKKREEPEEQIQEPAIIEDGDSEDEDPQNFIQDENEEIGGGVDINDVDPESKFGKKAMAQLRAQEEEEANQNVDDNTGGGIKMGKIGRRGRKKAGGVERSEPQKKVLVNEAPKRTFGGYSEDDIEYMRKSIQALCQATNPLGKSIDFVTEDIDSMVKEYEHWKLEYAESQSKLVEQQRITEQTIQPLQDVTLAQLEERIREEKSKIQNIRSQIIRNDNTIQNLLQSVISSG